MRQDYIHALNDPARRAEFIQADASDTWAPKSTRCFQHSTDVTTAWKSLATTVSSDPAGTILHGADEAIAEHLNKTIPVISNNPGDSWISVDKHEVTFGTYWTADDVADLVSRDILSDTELIAAINTARTTPEILEAIKASARAHDGQDAEAHAILSSDSSSRITAISKLRAREFPSHPTAALTPPSEPPSSRSAPPPTGHANRSPDIGR